MNELITSFYLHRLRLIAAESVVFIANQIELLRPYLLELIPPDKEHSLLQFFNQESGAVFILLLYFNLFCVTKLIILYFYSCRL